MSKKIAMAALLATGVVGMAIAPASADKGPNNITIHADEVVVEAVCSFGDPLGFVNSVKDTGDHGLHTVVWHNEAESWVSCNNPATVTTKLTATTPEHTVCGLNIDSNLDELDGYAFGACEDGLLISKYSDNIKKLAAGQWYTVHFAGKAIDGEFTPLQAGTYNMYLSATAVPD